MVHYSLLCFKLEVMSEFGGYVRLAVMNGKQAFHIEQAVQVVMFAIENKIEEVLIQAQK